MRQHIDLLQQRLADYQPALVAGEHPDAAVLVAITRDGSAPKLLLTRRAAHMKLHPGESAFPGGKCDPDDVSSLATALREANEEVGLNAVDFQQLGQLDQWVTGSRIRVTPVVGLISDLTDLTPNLQELDVIFKVPLDFFMRADNLNIERVLYSGRWWVVPRFEYEGFTISGVTALIIVNLMNTVFDADIQLDLGDK